MSTRLRRRRQHEAPELNITAFMNLMVALVPFLLITAVFSRITILELNLPAAQLAQNNSAVLSLQLEVIVRRDELIIAERNSGPLQRYALQDKQFPYAEISTYLQQLKARVPDKQDISLLLDADVNYDTLVQVMDVVRAVVVKGQIAQELFPQISIGDAPPRDNKT